jgi:hypothetical protein
MQSGRVPGFVPSRSGLHFKNSWVAGTTYPVITLPQVGTVVSGDATNGLCGGFVLTALDCFLHRGRLSTPTTTSTPPAGTPLFNYLVSRLMDSFLYFNRDGWSNCYWLIRWIMWPSHDTDFSVGLARQMVEDQWPRIKADIDSFVPSPLQVVGGAGLADPLSPCGLGDISCITAALHNCHQVLAYAYNLDDANNLILSIYDCNDPLNDSSTIELNIGNPTHTIPITANGIVAALGRPITIRAIFREEYHVVDPVGISNLLQVKPSLLTEFNDHDGDRKADFGIWRPSNAEWWVINSSDSSQSAQQYGQAGDIPVPGDYDGDGRTDFAIWRPATGEWWVFPTGRYRPTDQFGDVVQQWGQAGDIPVPGDYDGDGKTDFAIWRPATAEWWVIHSSDGTQVTRQWGQAGDIPVPGDYDGDGKTDFAIWRPATAEWWVLHTDGSYTTQQYGQAGDVPVPGDYDGDGKSDFAIWRPATFEWWVLGVVVQPWGQVGDIPVPGDYDGDGKTDFAVWRPTSGEWWVIHSSDGVHQPPTQLGQAGDVPV